jgi:hypothetical protein
MSKNEKSKIVLENTFFEYFLNIFIGLYPYTFSSPKCEIPCKPILIEKSKTKMMRLYGSKFDIFEYEVYNTIKAANINNPFMICAYIDGVIIYIIYYYYFIILFKIFAYCIMSEKQPSRKQQQAQQAANKTEKNQIRERRRREEVLSEMLKQQYRSIREKEYKIRQTAAETARQAEAEAESARHAKYIHDREAEYRKVANAAHYKETIAGIEREKMRINQNNMYANAAAADVNTNQNQNEAAAAADDDGEFDMPEGIEFAQKQGRPGKGKKSAKKRATKKRATKRRNRRYKNKSNKRI